MSDGLIPVGRSCDCGFPLVWRQGEQWCAVYGTHPVIVRPAPSKRFNASAPGAELVLAAAGLDDIEPGSNACWKLHLASHDPPCEACRRVRAQPRLYRTPAVCRNGHPYPDPPRRDYHGWRICEVCSPNPTEWANRRPAMRRSVARQGGR